MFDVASSHRKGNDKKINYTSSINLDETTTQTHKLHIGVSMPRLCIYQLFTFKKLLISQDYWSIRVLSL